MVKLSLMLAAIAAILVMLNLSSLDTVINTMETYFWVIVVYSGMFGCKEYFDKKYSGDHTPMVNGLLGASITFMIFSIPLILAWGVLQIPLIRALL